MMKALRSVLVACALVVGVSSLAMAQVATSYTVTILSGTTVVSTTVLPASSFLCGQTPLTGSTINPRHIEFVDPNAVGKDCIYTDPGTGLLASLPFGSTAYTATLIATNGVGSSPVSAPSPLFTEPGVVPAVLTGVQVVQ